MQFSGSTPKTVKEQDKWAAFEIVKSGVGPLARRETIALSYSGRRRERKKEKRISEAEKKKANYGHERNEESE